MNLLKLFSFPLAFQFGIILAFRNAFYDWGWFSSTSFKTPTICIGNISMAGTGKTPMTALLIELLQSQYKIAVLTRGYGRKSKGLIHANEKSSPVEIGDEPKQLLDTHPNIELIVCANRVEGMRYIESNLEVNLVILDDAFQHRKLSPLLSILLTTYSNLYTEDYYFPAGNLRDHKSSGKRAQMVVVTKAPENLSETEIIDLKKRLKVLPHQSFHTSSLQYSDTLIGLSNTIKIEDLKKNPFCLVTGIANPKPLVSHLKAMGCEFTHKKYRDHHNYNKNDFAKLKEEPLLITTQKDFVKLSDTLSNVYYLPVTHKIHNEGYFKESLINKISD